MKYLMMLVVLMTAGGCRWTSPNTPGADGAKGEQGPDGERGPQGIPGEDGADGESCVPVTEEGCVVIVCGDQRSEPICPGRDGNGNDGSDGTSCTVTREGNCATVTCGQSEATICDGIDGISCSIRRQGDCLISWCTDGRQEEFCEGNCSWVFGEMDEEFCAPYLCDGREPVQRCIDECSNDTTCLEWYGEGFFCNPEGWCEEAYTPAPDQDHDGISDDQDNCPANPNPNQEDMDHDGIGNACDEDGDGDGVADPDNCSNNPNPNQRDSDGDGLGDACDPRDDRPQPPQDADGDGIPDNTDSCPLTTNPRQEDLDRDGIGDACDSDLDGDGIVNHEDNCVNVANRDQADNDGDRIGNVCDASPNPPPAPDRDADGIPDAQDNCPDIANRDQRDSDQDGIGDLCEEPLPNGACRPFSVIVMREEANISWYSPVVGDPATRSVRVQAGEHRSVGEECAAVVNDANAFCRTMDGLSRAAELPEGGFGCRHNAPAAANDDVDNDGILDGQDNCPFNANRNQADANRDGIGDVCQAA